MKKVLIILFFIFLTTISIGGLLVLKEHPKGQLVVGLSVVFLFFILIPLFIYYRYEGGKYKKYQLNDKKIKEWMNQR